MVCLGKVSLWKRTFQVSTRESFSREKFTILPLPVHYWQSISPLVTVDRIKLEVRWSTLPIGSYHLLLATHTGEDEDGITAKTASRELVLYILLNPSTFCLISSTRWTKTASYPKLAGHCKWIFASGFFDIHFFIRRDNAFIHSSLVTNVFASGMQKVVSR